MKTIPTGQTLGATVEGLDLSRALSGEEIGCIERELGAHGLLRFPRQHLTALQLARFSAYFGELEIHVASAAWMAPGVPEVMVLSNIERDAKPIGFADAGRGWHTDMSYSRTIAFATVLYGIEIPHRDGRPLGATKFSNMVAAYEGLSAELKRELEGKTIRHDFEKFWEMMRREQGSKRPPLTDAQRKQKPPVSHPAVLVHPISGRKVLYANPGYSVRINELSEGVSNELLALVFAHQVKPEYQYTAHWQRGDVLVADNLSTIHTVVADYRPDEHRHLLRCQVMTTKHAV